MLPGIVDSVWADPNLTVLWNAFCLTHLRPVYSVGYREPLAGISARNVTKITDFWHVASKNQSIINFRMFSVVFRVRWEYFKSVFVECVPGTAGLDHVTDKHVSVT